MAVIITTKRDAGGGWFEAWVGTDNTTNPNTERVRIVQVRVNKAAYDALAAAGKTDINNQTLNNIITAAFS